MSSGNVHQLEGINSTAATWYQQNRHISNFLYRACGVSKNYCYAGLFWEVNVNWQVDSHLGCTRYFHTTTTTTMSDRRKRAARDAEIEESPGIQQEERVRTPPAVIRDAEAGRERIVPKLNELYGRVVVKHNSNDIQGNKFIVRVADERDTSATKFSPYCSNATGTSRCSQSVYLATKKIDFEGSRAEPGTACCSHRDYELRKHT